MSVLTHEIYQHSVTCSVRGRHPRSHITGVCVCAYTTSALGWVQVVYVHICAVSETALVARRWQTVDYTLQYTLQRRGLTREELLCAYQ